MARGAGAEREGREGRVQGESPWGRHSHSHKENESDDKDARGDNTEHSRHRKVGMEELGESGFQHSNRQ